MTSLTLIEYDIHCVVLFSLRNTSRHLYQLFSKCNGVCIADSPSKISKKISGDCWSDILMVQMPFPHASYDKAHTHNLS